MKNKSDLNRQQTGLCRQRAWLEKSMQLRERRCVWAVTETGLDRRGPCEGEQGVREDSWSNDRDPEHSGVWSILAHPDFRV